MPDPRHRSSSEAGSLPDSQEGRGGGQIAAKWPQPKPKPWLSKEEIADLIDAAFGPIKKVFRDE